MTVTIPADLGERLSEQAARAGLLVEDYTIQLLERSVPQKASGESLSELLRRWIEEDEALDDEDDDYDLLQQLDANRSSSYRKLFPPELKGISW